MTPNSGMEWMPVARPVCIPVVIGPAPLMPSVRRMHAHDSPEGRANVAAIESKLKKLDEVFRQFCSREGYNLSALVDLWPRRRVWRRQEIDRKSSQTVDSHAGATSHDRHLR
jgi:hypothetical protein